MAIDYDEHRRLKILVAILPACLARGMSLSAAEDLAIRGGNDGSFLLGADGALLGLPASDFVASMSEREDAKHLFPAAPTKESAAAGEMVCGMAREKFEKLKPEAKLKLANEYQPSKDRHRE
jgi:hypothetical protein